MVYVVGGCINEVVLPRAFWLPWYNWLGSLLQTPASAPLTGFPCQLPRCQYYLTTVATE